MFPGNIERRRSRRGAPGCSFYEEMGRASYRVAASHEVARHRGLTGVFNGLAEQFHEVRLVAQRSRRLACSTSTTIPLPPTHGLALLAR